MRKIMRARMRDVRRDEGGFVLITVIITAVALSLLVTIALDSALAQTKQARRDQDFQGALAAAEAGVDDYLSYLNNNDSYFDVLPTSVTTDPNYNPASNPLTAGKDKVLQWPLVPGSAASTPARFHYSVNKSTLASTGEVTLEVTGNVGKRFRTVKVKLGRLKFTDYVYFSDVEVNDPQNPFKNYPDRAKTEADCMRYRWVTPAQARPGDPHLQVRPSGADCFKIAWTNNDIVYGPFHTNDLPEVSGGVFTDRAEAGCAPPGCGKMNGSTFLNYEGSGGTFAKGDMVAKGVLPLPAGNSEILKMAQPGQSGCLYTGPTRIILKGSTFDVYSSINQAGNSPLSRSTNGPGCGTFTKGAGGEWSAKNVPIPANGVVYVQGVPTDPANPNFTDASALRTSYPHLVAPHPLAVPNGTQVTSPGGKKLIYSPGQSYEWPLVADDTAYAANAGDVFVEGVVNGRLTIATQNNIMITGDITYANTAAGSDDMLGLVASNSLWLYHPVDTDFNGEKYDLCPASSGCMKNIRIDGAIMSVTRGFGAQWPDSGLDFGTINLFGSLTQAWRNNVGGGSPTQVGCWCKLHTGYGKNYRYDPRLNYSQPPHFLKPQVLAWTVKSWSEVVG